MDTDIPIPPTPKKKQVHPKHHAQKGALLTNFRHRKIIEAALTGKPFKQTGIELGYSPKTAERQVGQILQKPSSQQTFLRILEESGLTDQKLADKLRTLIDAQSTQYFQFQGKVEDERVVPALETQRKTAELVCRLRGHLHTDASNPDITIGLMQIVVQQLSKGTT